MARPSLPSGFGLWTPEPQPAPERTIQGSVIGYRAWRIVDWQLYGTGVNRAWMPGVNEATCNSGDPPIAYAPPPHTHPAPAIGCHCGITALARFTTSDEHWYQADVFGAIEAWGEDGPVERVTPGDVAEAAGVDLQAKFGVTPFEAAGVDLQAQFGVTPFEAAGVDLQAQFGVTPFGVVCDLPAAYKPAGLDQGMDPHEDSGGFILHRDGFRSRYGKVVLLAVDDEWPAAKTAAVCALAKEHGADVCRREHLEDAAKEHGQLVDEELLEWVAKDEPEADYLSANVRTIGGTVWSFSTAYPCPSYPNAAKGAHQRWHVNRGIVKSGCPYCEDAEDDSADYDDD